LSLANTSPASSAVAAISTSKSPMTGRARIPGPTRYPAASSSATRTGISLNAAKMALPLASAGPKRARRTTCENDSPSRFARRSFSYASDSNEMV
jgi:hypothetical protein